MLAADQASCTLVVPDRTARNVAQTDHPWLLFDEWIKRFLFVLFVEQVLDLRLTTN